MSRIARRVSVVSRIFTFTERLPGTESIILQYLRADANTELHCFDYTYSPKHYNNFCRSGFNEIILSLVSLSLLDQEICRQMLLFARRVSVVLHINIY